MTKKILTGVLAAASALSVSATAFAAPAAPTKTTAVTSPGETEYEVEAAPMSAVLDVTIPATMQAFLNPYGAEVKIDAATVATTSNKGIVSWAYEIENKTVDYGIFVDVKDAKATVTKGITLANDPSATLTGKTAAVVLMGANETSELGKDATLPAATTKATSTAQGAVVFTSTATSTSKVVYVEAGSSTASKKAYMGITGAIGLQDATGEDVEWTEDDVITTSFILKINPAAKTAGEAAFSDSTGATSQPLTGITGLTVSALMGSGAMSGSFSNSTSSYTVSGCASSDIYTITPTLASGWTSAISTANGSTINGANVILSAVPETVTITLTNGSSTETVTVQFTTA